MTYLPQKSKVTGTITLNLAVLCMYIFIEINYPGMVPTRQKEFFSSELEGKLLLSKAKAKATS